MKYAMILMFLVLAVVGCGSGETISTGGQGGQSSTTSAQGGEGGSATTTESVSQSSSTTTSSTTTSAEPPSCGEERPKGCLYPAPYRFKAYNEGSYDAGSAFGPLPGEAEKGAHGSCFEAMLVTDPPFTRAVIAYAGEPPATLAVDVWLGSKQDPEKHAPTTKDLTLEAVEVNDATGLTQGVYLLPAPLKEVGKVPCMAVPLTASGLVPALLPNDFECVQPLRAWWYGVPVVDGVPTWAPMECPVKGAGAEPYPQVWGHELRP